MGWHLQRVWMSKVGQVGLCDLKESFNVEYFSVNIQLKYILCPSWCLLQSKWISNNLLCFCSDLGVSYCDCKTFHVWHLGFYSCVRPLHPNMSTNNPPPEFAKTVMLVFYTWHSIHCTWWKGNLHSWKFDSLTKRLSVGSCWEQWTEAKD